MKREIIYSLKSPYRDEENITGYRFGCGKKSVCIVGAIRGNEIQQLYICSQLVKALRTIEREGGIVGDNEILIIPSANAYSMNIGKRFWMLDNTDINRMFPGYDKGETTQRIAAGIFEKVQGYTYGIQFASFYMQGDFIPHVRMMDTGFQNASLANLFGLPYVVIRKPKPFDTTTLNYNWQLWNTNAFSVYTNSTDKIDEVSTKQAVAAVLRFLMRMGIIKYHSHGGYIATVVQEESLMSVRANAGGIVRLLKKPGDEITRGDIIAEILHPYEGEIISEIAAPVNGIIFFSHNEPTVMENNVIYKIIKRLHE